MTAATRRALIRDYLTRRLRRRTRLAWERNHREGVAA